MIQSCHKSAMGLESDGVQPNGTTQRHHLNGSRCFGVSGFPIAGHFCKSYE